MAHIQWHNFTLSGRPPIRQAQRTLLASHRQQRQDAYSTKLFIAEPMNSLVWTGTADVTTPSSGSFGVRLTGHVIVGAFVY